jgi:hypothetical protein
MRVLRVIGFVAVVLALIAGLAWLMRSNPIGPMSGRAVSGAQAPYPPDWSFTDEHMTIAVESRPDAPHSVTTLCFEMDGQLYVPAQNGAKKRWTRYVTEDPRVRLKIGELVYPANAVRIEPEDQTPFLEAAGAKYSRLAESDEVPDDVWLFRIDPRP